MKIDQVKKLKSWCLLVSVLVGVLLAPSQNIEAQTPRPHNGGRGPGGGDVLVCSQSQDNRFQGFLSYDYVQTRRSLFQENTDEFEFPGVESCLGKLEAIHYRLKQAHPVLASGLREYIDSLPFQPTPRPSAFRRWVPISYQSGPIECLGHDIQDETAILSTPNCRRCQVFIRDFSKVNPELIYTYDARILAELIKEPRQCSYALIHEWARDFLPDSKDLYFFTRMLHGQEFHDKGLFDLTHLPLALADCFNQANQMPLQENSIAQYMSIVSQVPPTVQELESFQQDMRQRFSDIHRELDETMAQMERSRPLGMSEAQVRHLLNRARADREEVVANLREGKLSFAQGYAALSDLREQLPRVRLPEALENPYLFDQIMNMESYPGYNTFRPAREHEGGLPAPIHMITPKDSTKP